MHCIRAVLAARVSTATAVVPLREFNMASDGPPGTDSHPSDLGTAIAALNTWSHPELQSKLAEMGAPTMGEKRTGKDPEQTASGAVFS